MASADYNIPNYLDSKIFAAEVVGTAAVVFFGLGGVANALLPGTKGHGMGFLGIALSGAWGVFVPLQVVGHVSSLYNPAVAFGLAAIKIISWRTMAVAWTGQFVGAFLGALIVWIIYFAHFQPVYGGPDSGRGIPFWQETSAEAHRFASAGNHLLKEAQLLRPEIDAVHPLRQWVNKVRGRGVRKRGGQGGGEGRASEEGKMERTNSKVSPKPPHSALEQRIIEDQQIKLSVFCTRPAVVEHYWFFCLFTEVFLTFCLTYGAIAIGDRGTIGIGAQPANAPALLLYSNGFEPFLKAILLLGLILAGGGVTGAAMNPARDLAPRLAHWLLPIPGKGSSEWWYSWVPALGPMIGGLLGALFARAMKELQKGTPL